jgi:hypothetical protein
MHNLMTGFPGILCGHAWLSRYDNCSYGSSSHKSRVHSSHACSCISEGCCCISAKTASRSCISERRLLEQELEDIVVRLESGLKARFFALAAASRS